MAVVYLNKKKFTFPLSLLDGRLDWRTMQTLTRSMPDLHKTLILAHIVQNEHGDFSVEEMAIATEHAPFRHRKHNVTPKVGSQVKKPKTSSGGDVAKQKETNETSSAE